MTILALGSAGCNPASDAQLYQLPKSYQSVELFSIDHLAYERESPIQSRDKYCGYPVWGSCSITDPTVMDRIVNAVARDLDNNNKGIAACFWPRHGLRIVSEGRPTDYLICYQCSRFQILIDGKSNCNYNIASASEVVLDDVLKVAGVKLASKEMPPKE